MRKVVCIAFTLTALSCGAQDLSGAWTASWKLPSGLATQAQLNIAGKEGTWKILSHRNAAHAYADPCSAETQPVEVITPYKGGLVLKISRAQQLRGCTNSTIYLDAIEASSMRGHFARGVDVSFTRG